MLVALLSVVFQISSSLALDPWGKAVSMADQVSLLFFNSDINLLTCVNAQDTF